MRKVNISLFPDTAVQWKFKLISRHKEVVIYKLARVTSGYVNSLITVINQLNPVNRAGIELVAGRRTQLADSTPLGRPRREDQRGRAEPRQTDG